MPWTVRWLSVCAADWGGADADASVMLAHASTKATITEMASFLCMAPSLKPRSHRRLPSHGGGARTLGPSHWPPLVRPESHKRPNATCFADSGDIGPST